MRRLADSRIVDNTGYKHDPFAEDEAKDKEGTASPTPTAAGGATGTAATGAGGAAAAAATAADAPTAPAKFATVTVNNAISGATGAGVSQASVTAPPADGAYTATQMRLCVQPHIRPDKPGQGRATAGSAATTRHAPPLATTLGPFIRMLLVRCREGAHRRRDREAREAKG